MPRLRRQLKPILHLHPVRDTLPMVALPKLAAKLTTFRLDAVTRSLLDQLAAAKGYTNADVMRQAVRAFARAEGIEVAPLAKPRKVPPKRSAR